MLIMCEIRCPLCIVLYVVGQVKPELVLEEVCGAGCLAECAFLTFLVPFVFVGGCTGLVSVLLPFVLRFTVPFVFVGR